MDNKITIITVVFNCNEELKLTINSVEELKLKYPNYKIEFIVIDGESNDGTREILDSKIIDHFVSEKDDGIYDAMNKGWNLVSNNSFVVYLGAGDKILSLPVIKDDDQIIIGKTYVGDYLFNSKVSWLLKYGNTVHHQSFMIRKIDSVNDIFDCKYKKYADFKFIQKCIFIDKKKYRLDSDFIAYADPFGVTNELDSLEMAKVVSCNFNMFFGIISYFLMKITALKIRLRNA
ncbi:hypothetical protein C9J41_03220 [Photobacterium sp. GB-50]|uniref:glycosyltransferase n=1 Tax=Photobacterium sp. GB-50 TaxID=2022107 RepID=UPI000D174DF0|nr:glycosyltransferase [Photobacterium sp. GB-50]PSW74718.1 hypothetical protein C9J41_03220 [Photobacterium sp. GB-50]